MNNLTVLIPTSPIPSHPSTAILDETIKNIRQYTNAKIVIMADGVHHSLAHRESVYREYLENVFMKLEEYGNAQLFEFPDHVHQAIMTRYVLENMVQTPLIMFCEHDTSPIGNIPFYGLCEFIEKNEVNICCVRFNIFDKIPDEHQYLMLDQTPQFYSDEYEGGRANYEIFLTRTIQWSQRPHIAKSNWYRGLLNTFMDGKKTMIEDVMHSVVQEKYKELGTDIFGLAIYTPEGNQLRSYHADGRQTDEKIIEG